MDTDKHVKTLQMAYAGALADTLLQYGKEGVLEGVTERKRREGIASGKMRAAQFGITNPEEAFLKTAELFGCAKWNITGNHGGFVAQTQSCLLAAIAKKIGAPCPCHLYCLDPMEGMITALGDRLIFTIEETLWDGAACRIRLSAST
jgi:hypothetical protein